jgi:hypothetical protein
MVIPLLLGVVGGGKTFCQSGWSALIAMVTAQSPYWSIG